MDGVSSTYRGNNGGGDRRSSSGYDYAASATSTTSMGPPSSTSRGMATNGSQSAYTSMTGAGFALQESDHPPSKSSTGGQSHAHRPVSAMPTPTSRSYYSNSRQADPSVLNTINNTAYHDRRASAHPTMSTSSTQPANVSPAVPLSPSGSILDAATASNAIQSGIPITSPAALQYFAAHPRRQQVHFGNYLLLQTLGEGEFGKVKLGVHKEWGEEVAVKLIKRDKVGTTDGHLQITGPSKDPSKMSKVEKEIRVLKDVRHPNIVRLYEVIESDRYIGIVLEYASGGELFDHILAHKYLKERDACRLFAQLISGVSYLHHKKIVHRDLKLENLLLDRNRNVIITDFGFANNFENRKDDLMATSCGSPCYAAPELVVQDGLYAGSAVDVWSCGVILYAMLAGYLPYDDDPKNPEGDNINLLYKYIMATPLSFPDYITAEPRDLLCKMLVPDPVKRADLETVMAHPWLGPYRDLFRFSVEDLERAAIEQQNKKRMVYRQQMMMQQQLVDQQSGKGSRSNGSSADTSLKQMRHQSAVATSSTLPDRMHESGLQATNSRSRPFTGLPTPIAPVEVPAPLERETPRTSTDIPSHTSSIAPSSVSATSKKSAGQKSQRHTVQLEYTGGDSMDKRREAAEAASRTLSGNSENIPPMPRTSRVDDKGKFTAVEKEAVSTISEVDTPPEVAYIPVKTTLVPTAERISSKSVQASKDVDGKEVVAASQGKRNSLSQRGASNPLPSAGLVPESPSLRVTSGGAGPTPEARKTHSTKPTTTLSPNSLTKAEQAAMEKSANRQRKGMSTDRAFFSRLMNGSNGSETAPSSTRPVRVAAAAAVEEMPATPTSKVEAASSETGRKSNRRKAMSLVVGRYGDQSTPATKDQEKAVKEGRRMTGRIRKTTLTKENAHQFETPVKAAPSTRQQSPSAASVLTTNGSIRQSSRVSNKMEAMTPFEQRFNESNSTVGPSSNAAKKVMDWFRKKSLSRGAFDEKSPLGPFDVERSPQKTTLNSPPRLVVTNEVGNNDEEVESMTADASALESVPSSRSTSGTHSQTSQMSDATALTTATEDSIIGGPKSGGNKSSTSTVQQQPTPRASAAVMGQRSRAKVDDSALRLHQGAVDQSALTSRPPNEVLDQVRLALFEMGIEAKKEREEEYKFECVRRKRAKTLIGATQGLGLSIRTSVFPPSQAELERSSIARPPNSPGALSQSQLSASPSTAGSLRNFLKRGGSQHNNGSSISTEDALPAPVYGEASVDGGQEVRFSVEVTKIKNLPGLYSLDIRRMKGNLWAYKFLYHALLDRCQLSARSSTAVAI